MEAIGIIAEARELEFALFCSIRLRSAAVHADQLVIGVVLINTTLAWSAVPKQKNRTHLVLKPLCSMCLGLQSPSAQGHLGHEGQQPCITLLKRSFPVRRLVVDGEYWVDSCHHQLPAAGPGRKRLIVAKSLPENSDRFLTVKRANTNQRVISFMAHSDECRVISRVGASLRPQAYSTELKEHTG
jgi:hypothetical protein